MILDQYIDRKISALMLKENESERREHVSSGKLTASMLGYPLQWQILKIMGVPPKPVDEYTLRKFRRGKDIEAWLVGHLDALKTQERVEYRDTVGIIDAVCDTALWDFRKGIIPVEVKSVANAKFKRIKDRLRPDKGHMLQACLYAMAIKAEHFAVAYVASDDLRLMVYIERTADHAIEVDLAIEKFQSVVKTGLVPVFEPVEAWQADVKYNNYPEWSSLSPQELENKIEMFRQNKIEY